MNDCHWIKMDLDEPLGLQIYELKLELLEIEPKIWRRVLVPGSLTLAKLHEVIQAAIGWTNSHLHEFIVGENSYSDPEFEIEGAKSEYRYRLAGSLLESAIRSLMLMILETAGSIRSESKTSSKTISDIRGNLFALAAREAALPRTAVVRGATRVFSKRLATKSTNSTKSFSIGLVGVLIRSISTLMM